MKVMLTRKDHSKKLNNFPPKYILVDDAPSIVTAERPNKIWGHASLTLWLFFPALTQDQGLAFIKLYWICYYFIRSLSNLMNVQVDSPL